MKIIKVENTADNSTVTVVDQSLSENNQYTISTAQLSHKQFEDFIKLSNKFNQLNYLLNGEHLSSGKQVSESYYENAKEVDLSSYRLVTGEHNQQAVNKLNVYKGMIKLVPLEKHYQQYQVNNVDLMDLKLEDIMTRTEDGLEQLKFKISYLDGSEKQSDGISVQNYATTGELVAYGKEARVLTELGKYAPVKVVCTRLESERYIQMKVECVQSQAMGMEKPIDQPINQTPNRGLDI